MGQRDGVMMNDWDFFNGGWSRIESLEKGGWVGLGWFGWYFGGMEGNERMETPSPLSFLTRLGVWYSLCASIWAATSVLWARFFSTFCYYSCLNPFSLRGRLSLLLSSSASLIEISYHIMSESSVHHMELNHIIISFWVVSHIWWMDPSFLRGFLFFSLARGCWILLACLSHCWECVWTWDRDYQRGNVSVVLSSS